MGRLHTAARQSEQARQAYGAACQIIGQVKTRLQHPELRASLEHSPVIQQVYDLR
jgi:hypothetical protein